MGCFVHLYVVFCMLCLWEETSAEASWVFSSRWRKCERLHHQVLCFTRRLYSGLGQLWRLQNCNSFPVLRHGPLQLPTCPWLGVCFLSLCAMSLMHPYICVRTYTTTGFKQTNFKQCLEKLQKAKLFGTHVVVETARDATQKQACARDFVSASKRPGSKGSLCVTCSLTQIEYNLTFYSLVHVITLSVVCDRTQGHGCQWP